MRSYGIKVDSNSNIWSSHKKNIEKFFSREVIETHRDEGHMMIEAEIGMMHLQVKECQGLPATTRR